MPALLVVFLFLFCSLFSSIFSKVKSETETKIVLSYNSFAFKPIFLNCFYGRYRICHMYCFKDIYCFQTCFKSSIVFLSRMLILWKTVQNFKTQN